MYKRQSQNHSFAVDEKSLQGTGLTLTHQNLLDGTAEGVACLPDKLFSVQYHPCLLYTSPTSSSSACGPLPRRSELTTWAT